ncbi:MAG: adenosyl-hopene transferase HpnH [Elusimicrobiota bacterium]|jgi:hopanoid biosynthesis associated radical SAM protein HpnH
MAVPIRMQLAVFKYILSRKFSRDERYPLVLMLEPLFACNLECAGCGKIQYPVDILRKRMTPEECWEAARECGAPIVTVAGGEPLIHPQITEIVEGLIARGHYVILCTNALLLEKNIGRFKPSSQFMFSVHLDGPEKVHDHAVCREGVYKTAVSAIRLAKEKGFHVFTNTTVFEGQDPEVFRGFFDDLMALGIDGITISPGYAYEKAPVQDRFLKNEGTRAWFRAALKDWRKKGWIFNHSPFYLDFLEGRRDYDCTPWGTPLRSVLGWQRPCYLISEGEPAKTFAELLATTDWKAYGRASGNPKCANCMAHVGYEPTSVVDSFSSFGRFLEMVLDYAASSGPAKSEVPAPRPATPAADAQPPACGCKEKR